MSDLFLNRIYQFIETVWTGIDVWPEYKTVLQEAVGLNQIGEVVTASRWYQLPQVCCQAAGGEPHWADNLTTAWLLFHLAAGIMDNIEDGDLPEEWWEVRGPAVALNVSSGLYFTASIALNNLFLDRVTRKSASDIAATLYQSFLIMSSGQHMDLTIQEPTLNQCWKIAKAKSGAFFSAGCRSGARLATANPVRLRAYECFGHHLGLLIQILDDLEDLKLLQKPVSDQINNKVFRSLGVAYSLEVLPDVERNRLRETILAFSHNQTSGSEAFNKIAESGAGLYLKSEIERHRSLAVEALREEQPLPLGTEILVGMVDNLVCGNQLD